MLSPTGEEALRSGISAVVLAFSHYTLGFTSVLADNIATVVGIGLGTLFRFWAYRKIVFSREQL